MNEKQSIVYHGGNCTIQKPNLIYSRKSLDFGAGFYVTNIYEQAVNWARRIARDRGGTPIVSTYSFYRQRLDGHTFKGVSRAWAECVLGHRLLLYKGNSNIVKKVMASLKRYEQKDFLEGEVADDEIYDAIDVFCRAIEGCTTIEEADILVGVLINRIKYKNKNHQICFRTQESLLQLNFIKAVRE